MKKTISLLALTVISLTSSAQLKLDDFGRVILNSYLPDNINLPSEAKSLLITKLNQIASNNGMGGSQANPRFIITANVNVGTKDIVAGPPQLIAQNMDITFFVGDAITNTIYSNTTLSFKGVGTNENKAFIEAIKTINPKNKELLIFSEEGKTKIINYYATQCDFILKQANTLADQFKFSEAIYELMTVPDICKDCYFKSKDEATLIFKKKIESDCTEKLKEAKLIWSAEPNENGALKAAAVMIGIVPSDNCKTEINKLSIDIKTKLQLDQKKKYDFDMLDMQKRYDTEQKIIDAKKQIALEQAKNQPKTISYQTIYWR
jgi:predicted Rdx family selenoprotein